SLLNLAHLQRSAGDLATAGEIYRGVLAADPVSVAGWDGIGLVFRDAGRIEEARNAFLRAVEADPESAESHYHLSFAYSELGQFAEALGAVTEAQKLHPYYAPTGYRLVVELLQGEAVLPIALDARTRGPGDRIAGFQFDPAAISGVFAELASGMRARPSPTAATGIAEDYIAKQQYDLATAEVQRLRAAGVDPTDCDLLDARILLARKLYGEALERFEAVLACRPDDYESAVGSAEALLGLQQPDRAYERLRRTTGESHDERVAVAVARALAETGRAGEALAALAELSDPTWKVLDLAGSIATQAGMAAEAREFYSHALHAHPDNAAVYFHLGELELRCDRVEEAVRQFERALAIEPRLHAASLLLARALRKSGDLVRAIDVLVDLLIEDPSLSEALLDLGHCLLDTSRDAAALTVFNRLVARDRGNVSAHFMAGIALARLKRYSDAITAWGMVADLEPESPLGVKARQHVQTAANLDSLFGVDS
ncbi:MAG: tetratricopeptide repeat protein, partial [Gemmatimonadales bacterium]